MLDLAIVWRNPAARRSLRARRIQKYDFGSPVYGVQELVARGFPDLWLTMSAFEVRTSHARTQAVKKCQQAGSVLTQCC